MQELARSVAEKFPSIKLVYLFGSRGRGDEGPLSDYDFAVYLEEQKKERRGQLHLEILNELTSALKTDAVDLVILNDLDMPEMKYDIIAEGKLLFEEEPFSLLVEPYILNDYFDFREGLRMNNLTKA
ncbi:MAG: nucleotidyltransferase domain-containing protein [Patescibacteria group bacterium]